MGLILSGLTGVGKSTLQSALLEQECWSPRLYTSRSVESAEASISTHVERHELVDGLHREAYVAPMIFAGEVYAWSAADFRRLQQDAKRAVLNARPYTALVLGLAISDLVPVWLDLDESKRLERLGSRGSIRDLDSALLARREKQDAEDRAYADLFRVRVVADERALQVLVKILDQK